MKLTLADIRQSDLPNTVGLCAGDLPQIAAIVNRATQRLLHAGGENGFWGCWQRVAFVVSIASPSITLPRSLARAVNMDVCKTPIRIQNEWYEFLPGGIGLQVPSTAADWCGTLEGYDRGTVPTMTDLTATNQRLRIYASDPRDVTGGAKLLITGLDANGLQIYSTLGADNVNGFTLTCANPFATTAFIVTAVQSIQKDITFGDITLKQVDATTGAEVTLARFGPTETNPAYRRYLITKLPGSCCCATQGGIVTVTALCKLQFVPVYLDTDQLLIGNIEALIEECQAIRYAKMDSPNGLALAAQHHRAAIKLLQNEQRHEEGEQQIAAHIDIFPNHSLDRESIGSLI